MMNDNNNNNNNNEQSGGVVWDDEDEALFASLFPNSTPTPFLDDHHHLLHLGNTSSYYVDDFSPPPPPPPTTVISSSSTTSDACSPVLITTNISDVQLMQLPAPNYACTDSNNNNNNNNKAFDCSKVLEDFDSMSMDVNNVMDHFDFWDSSSSSSSCSIFQDQIKRNNSLVVMAAQQQQQQEQQEQHQHQISMQNKISMQNSPINIPDDNDNKDKKEEEDKDGGGYTGLSYFLQGESELSAIFLEWVIKHKDSITADELINIKLKRSTIEQASNQLGNTKNGKKRLLKLILSWLDHNLLFQKPPKNKNSSSAGPTPTPPYLHPASSSGVQSANFYCNPLIPSTWIHPPTPYPASYQTHSANQSLPYASANRSAYPPAYHPIPFSSSSASSIGYAYDPNYYYWNANTCVINPNPNPNPNPSSSSIVESLAPPHFAISPSQPQLQQELNHSFWVNNTNSFSNNNYNNNNNNNNSSSSNGIGGGSYHHHQHQQVMVYGENGGAAAGGPLATKEARKKRMARHKRHFGLGLGVHHNHNHNHNHNQLNQNYSQAAAPPPLNLASPRDQLLHPPADAHPPHQVNAKKKKKEDDDDGLEENKMQLILHKVLKQSDVGNLGRIVLPKKEAEMHLPELITRDGIPITVEDIVTSNVWTLRYRFWPNNNSRMYLFENTGEFVRANDLQQGDYIALYFDTKTGKYLIKGMKIHPSSETNVANNKQKTAKKGRKSAPGGSHRSTSVSGKI